MIIGVASNRQIYRARWTHFLSLWDISVKVLGCNDQQYRCITNDTSCLTIADMCIYDLRAYTHSHSSEGHADRNTNAQVVARFEDVLLNGTRQLTRQGIIFLEVFLCPHNRYRQR